MAVSEGVDTIETRIRSKYDKLPPSERRLANVILEFPGEIAAFMAQELTDRAGVSKAAATRLFKRLGYRDYNEVRREARDARVAGSPVHLNRLPSGHTNLSRRLADHLEADIASLTRSIEGLEPSKLSAIISRLVTAKRIYIVGFRNSYFFGAYLQSELARIRPNVVMLPQPGQTLAESLVSIDKDDFVVMVGLRRRVRAAMGVLQLAEAAGAETLYITDHGYQPAASASTWVVRIRVAGISLFDSYVSVVSIFNLLCTAASEQLGDAGRSQLKRIDLALDSLGELSDV